MGRRLSLIGLVAVLLVAGTAVALYTGIGPAPGGGDSGEQLTAFPTGTPLGTSAQAGGTASTATAAPFSFVIDSIEECGRTCRDVTVTLANEQDEQATDVVVYTRLYAGQDNTADDDLVWQGKEEVGTLAAGGSHTATKRVELSLQEALKIENGGGYVTIVTTVQTAERTVTFKDVEQVA